MTGAEEKLWFVVYGHFWDEEVGSIDADESHRAGCYEARTFNEAARAFADEFAKGELDNILIRIIVKCGREKPYLLDFIDPRWKEDFLSSVARHGHSPLIDIESIVSPK